MEIAKLFNALPSAGSQGVIWGIMAIGVYITYRILDVADLTVDGSIATGGAVAAVLIIGGCNVWIAMVAAFLVGMLAGLATGIFHTFMGIPAILAGILTQLSLYSINLRILGGKANMAVSVNNYPLLVSARNARVLSLSNPIFILAALAVAVIALLYWFFGTERGCSLRATGANANMARAQGINTNADKVLGLMLSNGLVAFSGALLTQYQGFVDVGMGRAAKRDDEVGVAFQVDDIHPRVRRQAEPARGDVHRERKPLAVGRVAEDGGNVVIRKGVIRLDTVCVENVLGQFGAGHKIASPV